MKTLVDMRNALMKLSKKSFTDSPESKPGSSSRGGIISVGEVAWIPQHAIVLFAPVPPETDTRRKKAANEDKEAEHAADYNTMLQIPVLTAASSMGHADPKVKICIKHYIEALEAAIASAKPFAPMFVPLKAWGVVG